MLEERKLPGLVGWYKIRNFLTHQENIKISNVYTPMIKFKYHDYFKNIGGILPNLFHAISIKLLPKLNSYEKKDAEQYILLVWK
jgi:hypothetical protein